MDVQLVTAFVLLFCRAVTSANLETSAITYGKSGPVCTSTGKRCITSALCDTASHECVCPAGKKGDGTVECVKQKQELCLSLGDPHLQTYGGAKATLAFPCRHRLTRFVTRHKAGTKGRSCCSFEVFGVNVVTEDGQFYERQLEVSLAVGDFVDQNFIQVDVKKYGITQDDIYQYFIDHRGVATPWGSTVHEKWNGINVYCTFDYDNNFAILSVDECNVRLKFRAANLSEPVPHSQVPGITIAVENDALFNSAHGGFPAALCGTLKDDENLYKKMATELGLTDVHLLLTYQVLTAGIHQNKDDDYYQECTEAIHMFKSCGEKVKAVQLCGSMLGHRQTVKCLMGKRLNPMKTFVSCLKAVCSNHQKACKSFLHDVKDCSTSKHVQQHSCHLS